MVSVGGTVTDTYTYNAAGALSTHNGKTYSYDAWDRLSGYTDGTASYTYKYDTDGLRTQKNDTQYVVDIHNNVIAEANESGSVPVASVQHRPNRQVRRVNITDFLAFPSRGSLVWNDLCAVPLLRFRNGMQAVPYGFTENRIEFIHRARNKPHKNN